jgi:transposase
MHPSLTTERIEQMCADAGVKLVYLPPYSTDLNPIEEFFGELKTFIKRNWHTYEDNLRQGFDVSGMVLVLWEGESAVRKIILGMRNLTVEEL